MTPRGDRKYAVIFSSKLRSSHSGYEEMAEAMMQKASAMPGFLGVESVRGSDGLGITVSYWSSLEAIRAWRDEASHREAQRRGRADWYEAFQLRIAEVIEERL